MAGESARESFYENQQQFDNRMGEPTDANDEQNIVRSNNSMAVPLAQLLDVAYPDAETQPSVKAELALDLRRAEDVRAVAAAGEPGERSDTAAASFVSSLVQKVRTREITIPGLNQKQNALALGGALLDEIRSQEGELENAQLHLKIEELQREITIYRSVLEPGDHEVIETLRAQDEAKDAEIARLRTEVEGVKLQLEAAALRNSPEGRAAIRGMKRFGRSVFRVGAIHDLLQQTA